ncbi:uncharacterized protein LOC132729032 [Ruditapes philippinarum]|uniref:uncharacterized protein LOC132729032 n=1 Tax=Ruditapes philippinarum TaxID=129788 RepID=UPI00295A83EA|nr:uncharacterized protein LOC132729032 [Ruditapes philippinarum]
MLRSVCFKNFVKFKEYQVMDFSGRGPFIFIGENCTGKSSVFEGIRRCLKLEYSTSISSVFDENFPSYFICNFETGLSGSNENIISGIVRLPLTNRCKNESDESMHTVQSSDERLYNEDMQDEQKGKQTEPDLSTDMESTSQQLKRQRNSSRDNPLSISGPATKRDVDLKKISIGEDVKEKNDLKSENYYKFAMKCSEEHPMFINSVEKSKDKKKLEVLQYYIVQNTDSLKKLFVDSILKQKSDSKDVDKYICTEFKSIEDRRVESNKGLESILSILTEEIVVTFPLRSIGPLQWSKSKRIAGEFREDNYREAEIRCEIMKYFLEDKGEIFDKTKEELIFKQLTQIKDYDFQLGKDGKIDLPKGKFALLKTPEGILEAKTFSILLSSKQYKTILLEEPDRGMHPQLVARMIQIMNQEKGNKRVILTTHQKEFISPWTVSDTFIFRRSKTKHRIISGKQLLGEEKDASMKDMRLATSQHISDIFFARKVLFYEGESEKLFLGELKRQILTSECSITSKLFNGDEDECEKLKRSMMKYTFIELNGKDLSTFYHTISDKLELNHLFLLDTDKNKSEQVKPERIFYWKDGDIEKMVIEMCKADDELANGLVQQNVISLDSANRTLRIKKKRKNKKRKLFLNERITCSNITESVRLLLEHCKPNDDLAAFIKRLMYLPF